MQDIKKREEKMKQKRMNTNFRDFLKEIASWYPMVFYRTQGNISRYPNSERVGKIVANKIFNEQRDDAGKIYLEYNKDKGFLYHFRDLFKKIPLGAMIIQMAGENTDYADSVVGSSNSYLSSVVINDCKNIIYSFIIFDRCTNVFNSFWVGNHSENIYYSTGVDQSTNIFYSKFITNSSSIRFSSNLIGCHECMFCDGLENQSYCIKNKQYSKEEYNKYKQKILNQKNKFKEVFLRLNNHSKNYGSQNVSGNHNIMGNNIMQGYFTNRVENARNIICVGGINRERNYYDCFDAGTGSYDFYGVEGAGSGSNSVFLSTQIEHSSKIYYSYYLINCSYCLGCVGLKNKSFCILNKQYTKEERFEKANEIFAQMEKDGQLGKFFPASMNPFYFNDTVAYLIDDSFTKEEVTKEGFLRRDEEIKVDIPEGSEIVKTTELSNRQGFDENGNRQINPEILKKVIVDEKGNSYRVIKMEYDFLMKYGLPLPELHWLDRIKLGFKFN